MWKESAVLEVGIPVPARRNRDEPSQPNPFQTSDPQNHKFKPLSFFDVDHFKNLYLICFNIASVLCFGFLAHEACEILASQPGIKPKHPLYWKMTSQPPASQESP